MNPLENNMRVPKEGTVAASKAWWGRSLSTKHPEVPVYETDTAPQLRGINTAPIRVGATTRVAAVVRSVQGAAGRARGINTSAISIKAVVRELKVYTIYADYVDDGLREEQTYVPAVGQLQGIDTSAISITAATKSLIIDHDVPRADAGQHAGVDTSTVSINATTRVAGVRTSLDEGSTSTEQAPQLQGIDATGIRINVTVE